VEGGVRDGLDFAIAQSLKRICDELAMGIQELRSRVRRQLVGPRGANLPVEFLQGTRDIMYFRDFHNIWLLVRRLPTVTVTRGRFPKH
jgi:hypothetical protein